MEKVLERENSELSAINDLGEFIKEPKFNNPTKPLDSKKDNDIPIKQDTNVSKSESKSLDENIDRLYKNLFHKRPDAILNENWTTENIHAKIVNISKDQVFVDCLVDSEKRIFQHRAFPLELFSTVRNLKNNTPVLVSIKTKPGSYRVDIFSGEGMFSLDLFEKNKRWEKFNNSGLDKKLDKW